MQNKNVVFFDLDGTLTESGEGITRSVQYALEKLGHPEPDLAKLRVFIGPPLADSFMRHYGFDRQTAEQGIAYYRDRFRTTGIFENALYPGIRDMLEKLKEKGLVLAVASSKPEPFIHQILDYFHIAEFFDGVTGSTLDQKRAGKYEVIEEALTRLGVQEERDRVLMVGDKEHDVIGARQAGVDCIAVLYGYGTREELMEADPLETAESVEELTQILLA